jgi:hypothetical protein
LVGNPAIGTFPWFVAIIALHLFKPPKCCWHLGVFPRPRVLASPTALCRSGYMGTASMGEQMDGRFATLHAVRLQSSRLCVRLHLRSNHICPNT